MKYEQKICDNRSDFSGFWDADDNDDRDDYRVLLRLQSLKNILLGSVFAIY